MRSLYHRSSYKVVLFSVIAIAPFYPSFFGMVYGNNTIYEFDRDNIDESSIIWSYSEEWDENNYSNASFLSVETSSNIKRDLAETNEIIKHIVKEGETYDTIASDFGISKDSIYWANDLSEEKTLEAWKELSIPPVSWLIYTVEDWDTLSKIAQEYKIDVEKIKAQNKVQDGEILKWIALILPGAEKKYVAPPPPPTPVAQTVRSKTTTWGYSFVKPATSTYVAPVSWGYTLRRRQPQHTFYWGNCTRFVWQYKNVNWWGNANQWLRNARAKGHATWYQATPWAIIVFWGSWYNPRYGHVWIVKKVEWNELVVVDMNYRRLNEVTYRRISANSAWIMGYIYVD